MDLFSALDSAAEGTNAVVRGVRPDQLGNPTPCTEWNVQQLMNHMIGGFQRFAARGEGREVSGSLEPASPGSFEETIEQLTSASTAAAAAWRTPGALERNSQSPFGEVTGSFIANITLTEMLMHGWDLAKATDQRLQADDSFVEDVLSGMRQHMPVQARQSAFKPELQEPAGAPAIDRLAAFLGRQP